mmetsp:Transcript_1988/g.8770  ORF Transcript_1988/g.8770 Transcript_1988/m.8770 type:complete len:213 (-) Transcript_1988:11336-11974(-)
MLVPSGRKSSTKYSRMPEWKSRGRLRLRNEGDTWTRMKTWTGNTGTKYDCNTSGRSWYRVSSLSMRCATRFLGHFARSSRSCSQISRTWLIKEGLDAWESHWMTRMDGSSSFSEKKTSRSRSTMSRSLLKLAKWRTSCTRAPCSSSFWEISARAASRWVTGLNVRTEDMVMPKQSSRGPGRPFASGSGNFTFCSGLPRICAMRFAKLPCFSK